MSKAKTAAPALRKTAFECPKCHRQRTIEALGRVVWPPKCQRCGMTMRLSKGGEGA